MATTHDTHAAGRLPRGIHLAQKRHGNLLRDTARRAHAHTHAPLQRGGPQCAAKGRYRRAPVGYVYTPLHARDRAAQPDDGRYLIAAA